MAALREPAAQEAGAPTADDRDTAWAELQEELGMGNKEQDGQQGETVAKLKKRLADALAKVEELEAA